MPTVVLVDDDADMRLLLGLALRRHGFEVVAEAIDGPTGLRAVAELEPPQPDVVVLDNRMPGRSGVEVARDLLVQRPDLPVVLFSAFLDEEAEAAAREAGVLACVAKNDLNELPGILEELLAQR